MGNRDRFIQRKKRHKTRTRKYNIIITITLGIIAIIILSLSLSKIIPMTTATQERLLQYDILKRMVEADDIAHKQKDIIMGLLGSGYNKERDRIFQIVDNQYHTAKDNTEKIEKSKKLYDLIMEENTLLQQLGKENADQEKILEEIKEKIERAEALEKIKEEVKKIQI